MLAGMATIMTTKTAARPLSFLDGLGATLFVGVVVSAYTGASVTCVLSIPISHWKLALLFAVPITFAPMVFLFAVPTTFVLGLVPISITYIIVRKAGKYFNFSISGRIGLGLSFGIFWACVDQFINPRSNFQLLQMNFSALADYTLPVDIVAASIALILVTRRNWFGVA